MLRRSRRLQEAGYYTEEGTPHISYKETLYKIFRRRTHYNLLQHDPVGNQDSDYQNMATYVENLPSVQTTATQDNRTPPTWVTEITKTYTRKTIRTRTNNDRTSRNLPVRIIVSLLLFILLAFGITNYIQMHKDIQELHQRLDSISHQVNMPNFALESQGARVVGSMSSKSYWPQKDSGIFWNKIISWWCQYKTQRRVIQGHSSLNPGECWSFAGEQGHLFISLSHPVSVSHVTLGHIRKSQSPNGYIASAPKKFSIYGMMTAEEEGINLGTLEYDEDGTSFQTFKLPDPDRGVFRYVKLQIESNWGNNDYTCLYSFRVHGKLPA